MKNINTKIGLSLLLLIGSIDGLVACADAHVHCMDGTPTIINMHYVASKAACVPMLTGGGNSLDVTVNFCRQHGGIEESEIPEAPVEWLNDFFVGRARQLDPGVNP